MFPQRIQTKGWIFLWWITLENTVSMLRRLQINKNPISQAHLGMIFFNVPLAANKILHKKGCFLLNMRALNEWRDRGNAWHFRGLALVWIKASGEFPGSLFVSVCVKIELSGAKICFHCLTSFFARIDNKFTFYTIQLNDIFRIRCIKSICLL